MLFKISYKDSGNRSVFPNILLWGKWVIEYDNQFKPSIEGSKLILGKFLSLVVFLLRRLLMVWQLHGFNLPNQNQ